MIETHVHLLPQMDDGPQNFPESLEMIKKFIEYGYTDIITTSHFDKGIWEPTQNEINKKVKQLNQAIHELHWKIKVYSGCELRLQEDLPAEEFFTKLIPLNETRYLLIDVYPNLQEKHLSQIEQLIHHGYIPILAHPERYPALSDEKSIKKLKDKGVLLQLTSASLVDGGYQIKKQVEKNLRRNIYDLIGSDSHNSQNRFYPAYTQINRIKEIIEESKFRLLTQQNCVKILNNEKI